MSLRDRLAALGVELHDIISANEGQVPAHNANSHEYFAVHYLGVNGENPYLYGGGYGGHFYVSKEGDVYQAAKSSGTSEHPAAFRTSILTPGTETRSASSAPHTRHPEGMMILRPGILRRRLRRRRRSSRRVSAWSTASRSTNWTWSRFKERVRFYMDGSTDSADYVLLKVGD